MISANGGLPAHRYTPQVTQRWPRGSEPASRMSVGSYGATEPHLWLMSKIPTPTWDDCSTTSERKSQTHTLR